MSREATIGLVASFGFFVGMAAFFFGIIFALSRYCGWSRLADRYPARGVFPKSATHFGYAAFRGWVGYNGCIILAADEAGLHVRTWPVFSLVNAPIFIPWGQVQKIVPESCGPFQRYRIKTIGASEVRFALRAGTFAHAREAAHRAGVRGDYD